MNMLLLNILLNSIEFLIKQKLIIKFKINFLSNFLEHLRMVETETDSKNAIILHPSKYLAKTFNRFPSKAI